jgi:hypothetical protein
MPDITSRPYRPDMKQACECCVFGTGEHAKWCCYSVEALPKLYMPAQVAAIARRVESDLLATCTLIALDGDGSQRRPA